MVVFSKPLRSNTSERGMSLISLITGIALSSVSMLAASHMHASHHAAIAALHTSIKHNRLLATALNTIQLKVQSAGYGIAGADENHVVTLLTPATTSTPAITSLLWRYMENGNTECRGIVESGFVIDGIETRTLKLLQADSCTDSNPLQDMVWTTEIASLGQWTVQNQLAAHISANDTLFSFALTTTECSVPGLSEKAEHLSATITAPDNATLNGHSLPSNSIDVCLINIYPN